ncbi:hypothetical protein SADUNF_Sadunf13G0069400 [Salix dunnii]|uniref:Uncharacterized protein n=1 Tax=Salix dunnii TaxID=1413687 RepID=A0A835JFV7_9ROSI|nr:hypothetical protein SADUNF_Sadunf13G0069400 [Salix dunnii]
MGLIPEYVRCVEKKVRTVAVFATKSSGFSLNSILKGCKTCGGKGAMKCEGYKEIQCGFKCFDCQGFGLKSCPICGKGELTPEQRGET